jgi:hypothetical protein
MTKDKTPDEIERRNRDFSAFCRQTGLGGYNARVAFELSRRDIDLSDVLKDVPFDEYFSKRHIERVLKRIFLDNDIVPLNDPSSKRGMLGDSGRIEGPAELIRYMKANDGYKAILVERSR